MRNETSVTIAGQVQQVAGCTLPNRGALDPRTRRCSREEKATTLSVRCPPRCCSTAGESQSSEPPRELETGKDGRGDSPPSA